MAAVAVILIVAVAVVVAILIVAVAVVVAILVVTAVVVGGTSIAVDGGHTALVRAGVESLAALFGFATKKYRWAHQG